MYRRLLYLVASFFPTPQSFYNYGQLGSTDGEQCSDDAKLYIGSVPLVTLNP
jgi:hypothetical protein